MKNGIYVFKLLWAGVVFGLGASAFALPQDCADDEVCFIDVKGAECADGTSTGFSITYRKGAKDLLIFLDGGGACWSQSTCSRGTATHLSAYGKFTGAYADSGNSSNVGMGELSNPKSPFSSDFNLIRVPYCTGDVFLGNQVQDYGNSLIPYKIRHVGYKNLELILAEVQKRIPSADRVVFYGVSAGGLGATWNVRQVASTYPKSDIFVINDGGTLFRPPYVNAAKLEEVYSAWGAESNSPVVSKDLSLLVKDVLTYNQTTFPKVRYGFMSTYNDLVMTGFAGLLKATKLTSAVRNTIVAIAEDEFSASSQYQVFYKNGNEHGFFARNPVTFQSNGVPVGEWVEQMISGDSKWKSIRPDISLQLENPFWTF